LPKSGNESLEEDIKTYDFSLNASSKYSCHVIVTDHAFSRHVSKNSLLKSCEASGVNLCNDMPGDLEALKDFLRKHEDSQFCNSDVENPLIIDALFGNYTLLRFNDM
jgi:hypothetical protein